MKVVLIIIFSLFVLNNSFAQKAVSANGGTATAAGHTVSWTIGEPVIATVTDANNTLTQGFHQTKITVTAINDIQVSGVEIKVYPNPAQDFVTIYFSEPMEKTSYLLFDLSGKLLEQRNIEANEAKIDMRGFAGGSYILKLNHRGSQPLQTFKIVKR